VSDVATWLDAETCDAPESLRSRMRAAVASNVHESVQNLLASAAFGCLRNAARHPTDDNAALELLTADALLTHACAAAALESEAELQRFVAACDAHLFEQLLPEP
jgi:hypothetical protein